VALGIAPLTAAEARRMIARLRVYPILSGARDGELADIARRPLTGGRAADIDTLVQVLLSVSDLALDCPAIAALDINPFFLYTQGHGGVAVDAFIALA
jgi:hypothetical protein